MIAVWILTAHLAGGLAIMPLATEADCRAALEALPAAIVQNSECTRIEMIAPSSPLAPEMAPIPPRKAAP